MNFGNTSEQETMLDHVRTPFVLFMDSEVRLSHRNSLWSLYRECDLLRFGHYSFASVYPRSRARADVALLSNQIFANLYYLLPAVAGACEQLMFINADKLKSSRFLETVATSLDPATALAKLFKESEKKISFFDGGQLFHSAFYSSFPVAFRAFQEKYSLREAAKFKDVLWSTLLFWSFILPFVLLPFCLTNPWWLASLLMVLWGQYRLTQELNLPLWFVVGTPVSASLAAISQLWAALAALPRPLFVFNLRHQLVKLE